MLRDPDASSIVIQQSLDIVQDMLTKAEEEKVAAEAKKEADEALAKERAEEAKKEPKAEEAKPHKKKDHEGREEKGELVNAS